MSAARPARTEFRMAPLAAGLACLALIAVAAALRLVGTDWDQGTNLHPDERHMMFVVNDSQMGLDRPEAAALGLGETWFATGRSALDPRGSGRLYVYGELPHLIVVTASRLTGPMGWPETLELARTLGAVADAYTVLAAFLIGALAWRSAAAGLGAAAAYAFAPLAIQHANFFTVDVWLTAAVAWSLVAAAALVRARSDATALAWAAVAGGLAGLAASCKLPGLAAVGMGLVAVAARHRPQRRGRAAAEAAAVVATAAVAFRLASPFSFAGPWSLAPAAALLKDYAAVAGMAADADFPPNWQWFSYGRLAAVRDLALWGLGPPASLAIAAGLAIAARRHADWRRLAAPAALCAVILAYWLANPFPALRYALPALPALCVLGAGGLVAAATGRAAGVGLTALAAAALVWGSGMAQLHAGPHSRVAASRWLWTNTQPGTAVANETIWDDALPVPVRLAPGALLTWPAEGGHFRYSLLDIDRPDSPAKARHMAAVLAAADLVVVSSRRMKGPMSALPGRFPMTAAYYRLLDSGELCLERVYAARPGYPVAGIRLDDSTAQESWSVYDHPEVAIYRKLACFDRQRVERLLVQALASGS